uniref:Uncharacterized protein n=1 Tax=Phocoena sinus TaxID=42100 RepID=A0A8C9B823_PHOSS
CEKAHLIPSILTKDSENDEFDKNCSKSLTGVNCSSLECCSTQEHAHSEDPRLTWLLEQPASLVKQLGVSVDITAPLTAIKIIFI